MMPWHGVHVSALRCVQVLANGERRSKKSACDSQCAFVSMVARFSASVSYRYVRACPYAAYVCVCAVVTHVHLV